MSRLSSLIDFSKKYHIAGHSFGGSMVVELIGNLKGPIHCDCQTQGNQGSIQASQYDLLRKRIGSALVMDLWSTPLLEVITDSSTDTAAANTGNSDSKNQIQTRLPDFSSTKTPKSSTTSNSNNSDSDSDSPPSESTPPLLFLHSQGFSKWSQVEFENTLSIISSLNSLKSPNPTNLNPLILLRDSHHHFFSDVPFWIPPVIAVIGDLVRGRERVGTVVRKATRRVKETVKDRITDKITDKINSSLSRSSVTQFTQFISYAGIEEGGPNVLQTLGIEHIVGRLRSIVSLNNSESESEGKSEASSEGKISHSAKNSHTTILTQDDIIAELVEEDPNSLNFVTRFNQRYFEEKIIKSKSESDDQNVKFPLPLILGGRAADRILQRREYLAEIVTAFFRENG